MARQIPLTRGLFATVSDEDYDCVSQLNWVAKPSGSRRENYYAYRTNGGRTVYLHRFIMDAPAGITVDHKNGNGLDNTRANLRLATHSQNLTNVTRRNQLGLRGVERAGNGYRANLANIRAHIRGSNRRSMIHAAFDYDLLSIGHRGEFAILNFPCLRNGGQS